MMKAVTSVTSQRGIFFRNVLSITHILKVEETTAKMEEFILMGRASFGIN